MAPKDDFAACGGRSDAAKLDILQIDFHFDGYGQKAILELGCGKRDAGRNLAQRLSGEDGVIHAGAGGGLLLRVGREVARPILEIFVAPGEESES